MTLSDRGSAHFQGVAERVVCGFLVAADHADDCRTKQAKHLDNGLRWIFRNNDAAYSRPAVTVLRPRDH